MQKKDNNIYAAETGMIIVRKENGEKIGDAICLSENDSIDNYEEVEYYDSAVNDVASKSEENELAALRKRIKELEAQLADAGGE